MSVSRQRAEEAAEELGLKLEGLTSEDLAVAYKYKARETHPDAGGTSAAFQLVNQAQGTLKAWLDNARPPITDDNECPNCYGFGHVIMRRGFKSLRVQCRTCNGRGSVPST